MRASLFFGLAVATVCKTKMSVGMIDPVLINQRSAAGAAREALLREESERAAAKPSIQADNLAGKASVDGGSDCGCFGCICSMFFRGKRRSTNPDQVRNMQSILEGRLDPIDEEPAHFDDDRSDLSSSIDRNAPIIGRLYPIHVIGRLYPIHEDDEEPARLDDGSLSHSLSHHSEDIDPKDTGAGVRLTREGSGLRPSSEAVRSSLSGESTPSGRKTHVP